MRILISHFYNEEYLLPWWLKHHAPLFDHGILINRGSTDRSVDICKQLVPHW
ncbi:glycosyltransferase family 2 protein, partial [Paenibacillus sp.]